MSKIQQFDHSVDLLRSILWQYNDAANLQALLQSKQDWYDENHVQFWEDWITDVFDLRTANSFGLSVWSVILNLPLFGETQISPSDYPAFGFESSLNFDNGNFATDSIGLLGLPDEQKRIILRLRYFQLTTRCAIPEINEFLNGLFGANEIYVLDGLNMTMTYVFAGPLAQSFFTIFQILDVLPRPAGVEVNFVNSDILFFGFDEFNLNFDNGSFARQ